MFFVGKGPKELCMQFKEFAPKGSAEFVQHMTKEETGPLFIETAFLGTRALTTFGEVAYEDAMGHPPIPERPPGTHQDLINQAQAWATAIDRGWNDRECGCMVHGGWYGTVKSEGTLTGVPGVQHVASTATVMFEFDPSRDKVGGDGRSQYYKATGGIVTWYAQASGGCKGGMSGTVPLDVTDVDGHPMGELRIDDLGNNVFSYEPSTGSWPDRWAPDFTIQCTADGTTTDLPMTNLNPMWWNVGTDNPPVTKNPDRLQGFYRWKTPAIDILWTWDLKRQP
jgi:hypothetical protein